MARLSMLAALAAAALLTRGASAAMAAEWANRTIYQVLTDRFAGPSPSTPCNNLSNYCGGTFKGIIQQLDYIQALGFDAVWISPVVVNAPGGYHGYWAQNFWGINPNFGSAQDLVSLSDALHQRGMFLMVDIVANHMSSNQDVSGNFPFNSPAHYHDCSLCPPGCNVQDYEDLSEMEPCRLAGLMDLNNTVVEDYVAQTLITWISELVANYTIDGLRIDTLPYVTPAFWNEFQAAAGVYCVGEVDDGNLAFVAPFQAGGADGSVDAVLSYPMYWQLRNVFGQQQSMTALGTIWRQYASSFSDVSILGTFMDNHDNQRFLNYQPDTTLYRNALAWVLLSDGIPIIYYGTEAGFNGGNDPACREIFWPTGYNTALPLAQFIANVTAYRKAAQVWSSLQVERWQDSNFYAFTKGASTLLATTNVGSNGGAQTRTITYLPPSFANGVTACNLFNPCGDCVKVTSGGFTVTLTGGMPKVYDPKITCDGNGGWLYEGQRWMN